MKTKVHMNFQFQDGLVSAHVTLTEFFSTVSEASFLRLSYHNTMREIPVTSDSFESVEAATLKAIDLRLDCYHDIGEILHGRDEPNESVVDGGPYSVYPGKT